MPSVDETGHGREGIIIGEKCHNQYFAQQDIYALEQVSRSELSDQDRVNIHCELILAKPML